VTDGTVTLAEVQAAAARVAGDVVRTPLLRAEALAPGLYLKAENLQLTGSFKVRGAFNRLRLMGEDELARGVVAASAGNHAQGVALAARQLGARATIVMPEGAPLPKLVATRRLGAEVVLHGANFDAAFARAREIADERGAVLVHAFDDPEVIAGQGTVALEILADLPEAATLVVPIGGGGLISGCAVAARALRPDVRVYGVQAAGAAAMAASLQAGRPVGLAAVQTIADGLAIKRPSERTFAMVRQLVDGVAVVDDDDIAWAMLLLLERAHLVAEGAGAAGVAALLAGKLPELPRPIVAVVSGGNVDVTTLAHVIDRGLLREGRTMRLRTRVPDRPGALAQLLALVAAEGGNVLTVEHDRLRRGVSLGETGIFLLVETRGPEHVQALRERLAGAGYALEGEDG
jgi:threonine dehydratase